MIKHGDCLDVMKTFPENHFSSVVTDPPYGLKFMGKEWDHGIPGMEFWKEALRVCKPGSFLLAFGSTRTYHRLTCAIEDAGWEIRDCLMWIYGSGFPKSHNISKGIDKQKNIFVPGNILPTSRSSGPSPSGCYGEGVQEKRSNNNQCNLSIDFDGYGTALKPAYEPIIMAMKPIEGTFANNAEKWGQAGINIDDSRVNTIPRKTHKTQGRWPANVILDEEAGKQLDEQSGILKRGGGDRGNKTQTGGYHRGWEYKKNIALPDSGGASRFFYCAKASSSERNGSTHPTVKPLKLMEYLIKLVMPPKDGVLLDPFAGSGTTIVAAKRLGFDAIGIEKNLEYSDIANARLKNPQTNENQQLDFLEA